MADRIDYSKWDHLGASSDEEEEEEEGQTQQAAAPEDRDEIDHRVYAAVQDALGDMGPEFTVMGGTRYGGSALGDETISTILSAAKLPLEKRPDFICHHFASWNALLWIRWISDDSDPFHDELYLCFPDRAGKSAITITDANKHIFKADMLSKVCQLAKQRGMPTLLVRAFKLLVPILQQSFRDLSPHLLRRSGAKKNDYSVHAHILDAYEAGLAALKEEVGEMHPGARFATNELAATYEAHAEQQDYILDQVPEAQRCFALAAAHYKTLVRVGDYRAGGKFGGNEDCTRLLKFKLAGVLKKLHQKELIEEAANLYLEINETGLAHAAALDAAAWGT
mmetsp:Transcript_23038/g.38566  ORF Transcript_23038/g.38566 Transcript_23038/m.38566 type:complete len:337 (+) Transcript_23038:90-1100(+)|eukprot:CAMPEP_0198203488 /NCGR_PEP_ID=MMETSP1445-20131203/6782_1 /TAXON_ID=36898 /ORGANISM="Pyramimonas sp., Strain CCMP2087" /LENGTH=336 /DNA_ID=CAMNT_0043874907 /DNA_START=28 /DNA_END=1038 /DNA_ORIENTATION=+